MNNYVYCVQPGKNVDLTAFLFDGKDVLIKKDVRVSIRRLSDGKFWNGSIWQTAYTELAMPERAGSVAADGEYGYRFTAPAGVEDTYIASVKYVEGTYLDYYKFTIVAQLPICTCSSPWSHLMSSYAPAGTFGEFMKKLQARQINKSAQDRSTGQVVDYATNGTTPVNAFVTTQVGNLLTRTPQ